MTHTLLPSIQHFIENKLLDFSAIPQERKVLLKEVSNFVKEKIRKAEVIQLVFICTHNSRRSHIAQLWAQTAAAYYGINNVKAYSGGTEATAFNPRAVKAMAQAGFSISSSTTGDNPLYTVVFTEAGDGIAAFSKVYDAPENPAKNFCAVMTCSHADENCPYLPGVEKRIALTYDDPKDFDNTAQEAEKYAERVQEIGRELLYAFSLVE